MPKVKIRQPDGSWKTQQVDLGEARRLVGRLGDRVWHACDWTMKPDRSGWDCDVCNRTVNMPGWKPNAARRSA